MPEDKNKPPAQPAAPAAAATPSEPESLDDTSAAAAPAANTPLAAASAPGGKNAKSGKPKMGAILSLREKINIFLAVFLLLVTAAGVVIYVTVKPLKDQTTTTSVGKLTDSQLAQLKGSTTLVGDAKQTLDIQSNTILEGQVLVRSDLNVAGTIKVGNGISLPTITITGSGNFGQLGVSGPLSVGGDTNLQGQLTVAKNLNVTGTASFGNLSVASISVTTLQLKGDIAVTRHITTGGGSPGRTVGTAVGTGGTVGVNGSDTAGSVTINTGTSPPAGLFVTISFVNHFGSVPHVVVTPIGSAAAGLQYYVNRDANGFSIGTASAPPASSNFGFDYIVIN